MAVASNRRLPQALTMYSKLDLSTTGQVVKASAGEVFAMTLSNSGAAVAYVKFYDKATAATSSDTPVHRVLVPAGGAVVVYSDHGWAFTNGICVRGCTGATDNDNTAPSSNQLICNLSYV